MQTVLEALRGELDQEADTTLRVLQRVPRDRMDWRPHRKSMTLGQLALHVARVPGDFARILVAPGIDFADVDFTTADPPADVDFARELGQSVTEARAWLEALDDDAADAVWSATRGGQVLFAAPRIAFVRSLMLNHWYHHRGQLCVYLRLLGVAVPPVYGPSADENLFS